MIYIKYFERRVFNSYTVKNVFPLLKFYYRFYDFLSKNMVSIFYINYCLRKYMFKYVKFCFPIGNKDRPFALLPP